MERVDCPIHGTQQLPVAGSDTLCGKCGVDYFLDILLIDYDWSKNPEKKSKSHKRHELYHWLDYEKNRQL